VFLLKKGYCSGPERGCVVLDQPQTQLSEWSQEILAAEQNTPALQIFCY
jgi:hypothetical protein